MSQPTSQPAQLASKKTWLVTYLNEVAEVVRGDRMVPEHGPMGQVVYHFWDDELSPNGPFLVVNAEAVSSIRLQPSDVGARHE